MIFEKTKVEARLDPLRIIVNSLEYKNVSVAVKLEEGHVESKWVN